MSAFKEGYDIILDLLDRRTTQKKKEKRQLSDGLSEIASLLDEIRQTLKQKAIPRREAKELVVLIYNANKLAIPFKEEYPDLANVFDHQLAIIGNEMQIADYSIKDVLREDHLSEDKSNLVLSFTAEKQIIKASEEMERAAGILSAYSSIFKQKGE